MWDTILLLFPLNPRMQFRRAAARPRIQAPFKGKPMKSVFISYVSENLPAASQIAAVLKDNGIDVWIDRNQLKAGQSWLAEIRKAIQQGSFFIPLFSKEWNDREKSIANEELLIAIEELRKRPFAQTWLIPVKINQCFIPDIPIGAGRVITDLHYVDFSKASSIDAFAALLRGLGVENPNLGQVSSDQSGWPCHVTIRRRDKYVGEVQFCYYFSGKHLLHSEDGFIELKLNTVGDTKIYCEANVFAKGFQTRGGGWQGRYWRGKSDEIRVHLSSGHRYELFVCGDNIFNHYMASPYIEMARLVRHSVTGKGVDLNDSSTWPKIQISWSEL